MFAIDVNHPCFDDTRCGASELNLTFSFIYLLNIFSRNDTIAFRVIWDNDTLMALKKTATTAELAIFNGEASNHYEKDVSLFLFN